MMDIIKLDEDFKYGLVVMKPLIVGLQSQTYVRLCRMWIEKLIQCAPHERKLRNLYLEQMCRHAEQKVLGPPFSNPPVEGPLPMIPSRFLVAQGVILAEESASWSDVTEASSVTVVEPWSRNAPSFPVRDVVSSTSSGGETTCTYRKRHPLRQQVRHLPLWKATNKLRRQPSKKLTFIDSADEASVKVSTCESPRRRTNVLAKNKVMKDKQQKPRSSPIRPISRPEKTATHDGAVKIETIFDQSMKAKKKKSSNKLESIDETKDVEEEDEEKKIAKLNEELTRLKDQNDNLNKEIDEDRAYLKSVKEHKGNLKDELVQLRNKLLSVERAKTSMESEHKKVTKKMSESIRNHGKRVKAAVERSEKLESLLAGLRQAVNENRDGDSSACANEWIKKSEIFEETWKQKISQLESEKSKSIKHYDGTINDLRKELGKRQKHYDRLEKQLQGQCVRMKTEVGNIKLEIEKSAKDNEIQLNENILSYKKKIQKLVKENRQLLNHYEEKCSNISRAKNLELWIQKLNTVVTTEDKHKELEQMFTTLEDEFRKQNSEVIKWAYHNEAKLTYSDTNSQDVQIDAEKKEPINTV